ncbi:MAG: transpeptidase family protein [Cytophagaceae bacterium]|jgi:cell division protein FtsI (penicillin-binding protein 3)|nr:transpeptidase family protein [Cytophagaceae bacterium]
MNIKQNIVFRFGIFYFLFIVVAVVIVVQVFILKFINKDEYKLPVKDEANSNVVEANRGDILDVNGKKIACSVPTYRIYMDMAPKGELPDKVFNANVDSLAICLSRFFNDKSVAAYKKELLAARRNKLHYYMVHPRKITHTELQKVKQFPVFRLGRSKGGFIPEQYDKRELPFGSLAARTIGKLYGESEKGGMVGIENAFNESLKGVNGLSIMNRIAGRWIPETVVSPVDGCDLTTCLDISIQDVAEHSLRKQLEKHDARYGVAILMEVQTGAVKAIVNLHRQSKGVYTEDHLNYAIAESAEPGSTFKLASMIALLEDGAVKLNDTIDTGNGAFKFYDRIMRDSKEGGYGKISVREAFEKSSNIGISRLVFNKYKENPRRFVDVLYRIGLNDSLGIALKGEGKPAIKYPGDKTWSGVTLPWMSIGYEVKLAPIQTLTLYNAVANNGKMVRPMFVKEISRNGKVIERFSPEVINSSICSKETVAKVRELLVGVVENGTAKNIKNSFYSIAGKTGTAQIAKGAGGYRSGGVEYQASFVGYFPADKPKYSCIVVVNGPSNNVYYGNIVAGTVFQEIADRVYASDYNMNRQPAPAEMLAQGVYPYSKGGMANELTTICNELNIGAAPDKKAKGWLSTQTTETGIAFSPKTVTKGIVPSVIGMGAKDAVAILEDLGMNVRIQGVGRAISQSLKAGTKYSKGNTIFINLDN